MITYSLFVFVVLVFLLVRRKPAHLLGLFALLIPLDTQVKLTIGGPSLSLPDLMIFLILFQLIFSNIVPRSSQRRILSSNRFFNGLAIYIILTLLVTVAIFLPTTQGIGVIMSRSMALLLVLSVPLLVRSFRDLDIVFMYWGAGAIVSTLVGILQAFDFSPFVLGEVNNFGRTFMGIRFPFKRSVGIFTIYSYYGTYVFPVLFYSILKYFQFRETREGGTWKYLVVVLFIFAGIVVTQSRSTWLAFLIGVCVFPLVLSLSKQRAGGFLTFLSVSIGLGCSYLLFTNMVNPHDVAESFVGMRKLSVDGRIEQWELAWELFIKNPFLGIGPKQYALVDGENVLHNMYLLILVEQGLVGGVATLLFLFSIFYFSFTTVFAKCSYQQKLISSALTTSLISTFCEVSFAGGLPYLSMWLTLGLCMSTRYISSKGLDRP